MTTARFTKAPDQCVFIGVEVEYAEIYPQLLQASQAIWQGFKKVTVANINTYSGQAVRAIHQAGCKMRQQVSRQVIDTVISNVFKGL